jgi:hypothetical protein
MSNNSANQSLAPLRDQYRVNKPVTEAEKSALELVFTDDDKKTAEFLREKETEAKFPNNENENLSLNVQELWQSLYEVVAKRANSKSRKRAAKSRFGTSAVNTAVPQSEAPKQADGTKYDPSGCPLGTNQSNNNWGDAEICG